MNKINQSKYDLAEMKLEESFKRLVNFAQTRGFSKSLERVFNPDRLNEIPKSALYSFEEYQPYFDETLLNEGYVWINLHLLGVFGNWVILSIELPDYKSDAEFISVNLSLSDIKIIENDWDVSSFYKIVNWK